MSTLWDKIQTYTNYAAWELANGVSTTPPKIGTDNTTMAASPLWLNNSVVGTTLKNVADSPPGGAGQCWGFTGATTTNGTNHGYAEFAGNHFDVVTDSTHKTNYVLGFWFKIIGGVDTSNTLMTNLDPYNTAGVAVYLQPTRKLWVRNKFNDSGGVTNIASNANGDAFALNTWYYIAYYRTGSSWKLFVNGVSTASFGGLDSTNTQNISYLVLNPLRGFSSSTINSSGREVRMAGLHWSPNSTISGGISEAALAEIYTAGITAPALDGGYTAEVMTATNGHFPEPIIITPTNISFGTEPLTATAEISYLIVSGEANVGQSFFTATAILTQPTLSFTFNDNTEIQTTFIASAEIINPFSVIAIINISNAANLMTASAEIGEHDIIGGISVSYPSEEATASALFVNPSRFGPDDYTELAMPMIANALMTNETLQIPANYRQLVKKHLPIFYGTQTLQTNARYVSNDGYGVFADIDNARSAALKDAASLYQMAPISQQRSWQVDTNVSGANCEFRLTGGQAIEDIKTAVSSKTFTYECWFTKGNSTKANLENMLLSDGSIISISSLGMQSSMDPTATYVNQQWNEIRITLSPGNVASTILSHKVSTSNYAGPVSQSVLNANAKPPLEGFGIQYNHLVVTGSPGTTSGLKIIVYINGFAANVFDNLTFNPTSTALNSISRMQFKAQYNNGLQFDEPAFYGKTLTSNDVYEHWNFINTFDPNVQYVADEFTAFAEFEGGTFFVVSNINYPELPVTASAIFPEPIIGTSRTIFVDPVTASGLFVEPYFYGNPDFNNLTNPMIATAETLPNVYRLDTAYYTYVQTNIVPLRFANFDSPNSNLDYGSDNDYALAAPFVANGSITESIFGLDNNSLLTDGSSYTTSGLIMKESEYNDNWGSVSGIYHFSFWMEKYYLDTNPNGLRIVANANGYLNNEYILIYQYGNHIYLQVNDQTHSVATFASTDTVNLFDGNKKHIVVVASHQGTNGNIKVYVNGIEKINASIENRHPQYINSNSVLQPNTETNNYPRFSIGCLITPIEATTLPVVPTPSQLLIDSAHWAVTGLNANQVFALFNAMPYSLDMAFAADFALAQNAQLINPNVGTGISINATALIASAEIFNPTLQLQFEKIVNVSTLTASALFVLPYYFADNITNISVAALPLAAQAIFVEPELIKITFSFPTMHATIKMQESPTYYDPYMALIIQESRLPLAASFGGRWSVGDID